MNLESLNASVVIPTYGRVTTAIELHSQLHALEPPPKRIIFVFQCNEEWTKFAEHAACAPTCSITISVASATKARNSGLLKVETDFVAFIDDDCVPVNTNWLEELLKPLATDSVGLVTGPVLGWSATSGRLPFVKRAFLLIPCILEPIGNPESDVSGRAHSVAGGNFAGRTRELKDVGGFSERFASPSLYEETELAIRFQRHIRKTVWYNANAQVRHDQQSEGGMRSMNAGVGPEFIVAQRRLLLESVYGSGTASKLRLLVYRLVRLISATAKRPTGRGG